MPCYFPLEAYRVPGGGVTFKRRESTGVQLKLACGQCIGCRLDRSRAWALRCVHEAQQHEQNSFLTLTYRDEDLPHGGTLVKDHVQRFMKRLRKSIAPKKVRYYLVGEYGEKFSRPHYHVLLFGHRFDDCELWSVSKKGERLYQSEKLNRLWGYGYCLSGDVTFESAAYCARYCLKKINGERQAEHYWRVCERTGEAHEVVPEFVTMSRRPGIGKTWFDLYKSDVYPHDTVVHNGKKFRPPRYYDKLLEQTDADLLERLKKERVKNAKKHSENNTSERLEVRHKVHKAKAKKLIRSYESES